MTTTGAMDSLAGLITRAAAAHPSRRAVRLDEETLSYAELDELSSRAAAVLEGRGVGRGDRVALMLPNVPQFAVLYYAILKAGAVVVPVNPLLKADEIAHCLRDCGAALLVPWRSAAHEGQRAARRCGVPVWTAHRDGLRDQLASVRPQLTPVPRTPEDTAVILYTSGTTGRPKGAELTHANILRNTGEAATDVLRLTPQDVIFGGLPLFHSFGQVIGLNCAVRSGACLTLLDRFDAERAAAVIARDRVTVMAAVPTIYTMLLALPPEARPTAPTVRVAVSGGAPLPGEVLRGFEETYGAPVLEGYGLSESSPLACINRIDAERRPGTIGRPIGGVRMRITDARGRELPDGTVGEIRISGHNVMKGYWNRPGATADVLHDGWLRTGDLGTRAPDGCFTVVGRTREVILRGGMNVYPREVEDVLYRHPAVAEAAVVPVPDETYGEEVGAAVVLKPDHSATEPELREFVRSRVAAYKYPRHIWFPSALPKGATGKILKRAVKPPAPTR
ncbi:MULTISPECIES: long-chain fatty acid--CoA ligase [unclassified Streptomyces]|uniref:long-chain-fatty-acid--CoA ligase n=1 Tax=unclassified Streptomyces TaxID=2593676 RepID=UPI00278C2342|nr:MULTISPECIES: long-chain fatty acid--CoA ligase [unclassified Streptomyces]